MIRGPRRPSSPTRHRQDRQSAGSRIRPRAAGQVGSVSVSARLRGRSRGLATRPAGGRLRTRLPSVAITDWAGRSAFRGRSRIPRACVRPASWPEPGSSWPASARLRWSRPWGVRLPRWLVLTPALAGAVIALTHALTAYVTKTLHLLGVIEIEFRGWVRPDEKSLILWDLLFYEPWFLGLGVLVMLGVLHHYGRTGGTYRGQRRLAVVCGATSMVWTAIACVQFI